MNRGDTSSPCTHTRQDEDFISEEKLRAIDYDTEDHLSILTRLHGSVWMKVLPYCLLNVVITLVVYYLHEHTSIDPTFSDKGHTFMSLMVSFLLVTRSNIAYARLMEAREYLSQAMKSCRELTQHMITFTRYDQDNRARQWRAEISRRTVALLRTTVSVLEYNSKREHAWKVPMLTKDEKRALLMSVGTSNERTPMVLVVFLRSAVASHVEFLADPLHVNKELRLYQYVSEFVSAYHGLMKLETTPFPFPLVQMARTFMFLWIFTFPFALVHDFDKLPALLLVVFFVTYGFVGLEFVTIEMDDPFGEDPTDFDVLGLARVVFEDIYLSVYDVDGAEAADALRRSIEAPLSQVRRESIVIGGGGGGLHPQRKRQHEFRHYDSTTSATTTAEAVKSERHSRDDRASSASTAADDGTSAGTADTASRARAGGGGGGRHRRTESVDAWRDAPAPPKIKVGTDRSRLLLATRDMPGSNRSVDIFGGVFGSATAGAGANANANANANASGASARGSVVVNAKRMGGGGGGAPSGGGGGAGHPLRGLDMNGGGCIPPSPSMQRQRSNANAQRPPASVYLGSSEHEMEQGLLASPGSSRSGARTDDDDDDDYDDYDSLSSQSPTYQHHPPRQSHVSPSGFR